MLFNCNPALIKTELEGMEVLRWITCGKKLEKMQEKTTANLKPLQKKKTYLQYVSKPVEQVLLVHQISREK